MTRAPLDERPLPDDYPVYADYLYVADGRVVRSDVQGTVLHLKRDLESQGLTANVVTNCDIFGREALREDREAEEHRQQAEQLVDRLGTSYLPLR